MNLKRRRFIGWSMAATVTAAASSVAEAHSPYSQWIVYRKKHLLIGCHRGDQITYSLAQQTVARLDEHLPDARSRVARAPGPGRLASLLGTDQLYLAVLGYPDAIAMRTGSGSFKPYGQVPLQSLQALSTEHVLVAHESFPLHHAWLVSEAISAVDAMADSKAGVVENLPQHPGAELHARGEPNPGHDAHNPPAADHGTDG